MKHAFLNATLAACAALFFAAAGPVGCGAPNPGGGDAGDARTTSDTARPDAVGTDAQGMDAQGMDAVTADVVATDSSASDVVGADTSTGTDVVATDATGADVASSDTATPDSASSDVVATDTSTGTDVVGFDSASSDVVGTDSFSLDVMGTDSFSLDVVGTDSSSTDVVGTDSFSLDVMGTDVTSVRDVMGTDVVMGTDTVAPRVCGTRGGVVCGRNEYCDFPDRAMCGAFDLGGVCTPRPARCAPDTTAVCACDGRTYPNACEAALAGFDVNHTGACPATSCDPQDATHTGVCGLFWGYYWDGRACVGRSGCSCTGSECDAAFDTQEICEEAYGSCLGAGDAGAADANNGDAGDAAPLDCRTTGCTGRETCEPCRGIGGVIYVCMRPGTVC